MSQKEVVGETPAAALVEVLPPQADIPNNPLPALLYRGTTALRGEEAAHFFETRFARNGWPGGWRNGIYGFHHFHCQAHEVLGIYAGAATVRLGGDQGITVDLQAGDAVILPAGVAHRRLDHAPGLGVAGAYPHGQIADLCRPDDRAIGEYLATVARVELPAADPIFGWDGPLINHWRL